MVAARPMPHLPDAKPEASDVVVEVKGLITDQGLQPRQHLVHDEFRHGLDEPASARLEVEYARLIAQHHALRSQPGTAERDGEAGMAGKVSTLGDRADERRAEIVEGLRRHDQDEARPRLLPSLDRVQVDMEDRAAFHQTVSSPTGGASSHC